MRGIMTASSHRRRVVAVAGPVYLPVPPPNGLWLADVRRPLDDLRQAQRLFPALAGTHWPVVIDPVDGIGFDIEDWGLYRLNEYLTFGRWYIRWDYKEEPADGAIGRDFHHVLRGALVVLSSGSIEVTIGRFSPRGDSAGPGPPGRTSCWYGGVTGICGPAAWSAWPAGRRGPGRIIGWTGGSAWPLVLTRPPWISGRRCRSSGKDSRAVAGGICGRSSRSSATPYSRITW